ncbi:MAG TPA: hypothetical protein VHB74_15290 [Devosia sp.]|nr:hypothetical protein [Devosia sp.]
MPGIADLTKLNHEIGELEENVAAALRTRLKDTDRRALRSEIELAMRRLDELRNRLAG